MSPEYPKMYRVPNFTLIAQIDTEYSDLPRAPKKNKIMQSHSCGFFHLHFLYVENIKNSPGQVWVINSKFFLQLYLCVCYRENQFGLIVGPGRALLTLARSLICPVNKFVRKHCQRHNGPRVLSP